MELSVYILSNFEDSYSSFSDIIRNLKYFLILGCPCYLLHVTDCTSNGGKRIPHISTVIEKDTGFILTLPFSHALAG